MLIKDTDKNASYDFPIIEAAINDEDDMEWEQGQQYFSIGHGDYDEETGTEPEFLIWVLMGDMVEKSNLYTVYNGKTHGSLWGHEYCDKTFKGRYEPETGRLSIAYPCKTAHSNIDEEDALRIIREAFPERKKERIFKW